LLRKRSIYLLLIPNHGLAEQASQTETENLQLASGIATVDDVPLSSLGSPFRPAESKMAAATQLYSPTELAPSQPCTVAEVMSISNSTALLTSPALMALPASSMASNEVPTKDTSRGTGCEGFFEGTQPKELDMVRLRMSGICIFNAKFFIFFFSFCLDACLFLYVFVFKSFNLFDY
jgi:hypothetical protein